MRRLLPVALLLTALGGALPAAAGEEDRDLDLIPAAAPPPPAPAATGRSTAAWETAGGISARRDGLAVALPPGAAGANGGIRSSIDLRLQEDLTDRLSVSFSDRADARWQDDLPVPGHRLLGNNLREAYLTFEAWPRGYLEAGRINQRSGIALGFNPTDFFRAGSQVSQASNDPQALRNNRLGSVMLRGQTLWEGGSATLLVAPGLAAAAKLTDGADGGLDLATGRTNREDRAELILAQEMLSLSPQWLVYREADRTRFGLNLSHPLGQSIILYGEWAGGSQQDTAAEAVAYGRRTGSLPGDLTLPAYADATKSFQQDATLGLSWTWDRQVTFNAEVIAHQAGFSRHDWRLWSAAGQPALAWYVRAYAMDRQLPMSRRELFFRAAWTDAIIAHLELDALAFVNPADRSWQGQISAAWDISEQWTAGLYLSATGGDRRSEWGSLSGSGTLTLQAVRYF